MKRSYKFDFSLKTKPFPHQIEAVEFIKGKKIVPLFDEQGLGKTKIVIDALCGDIEKGLIEGALIVCKKYLIPMWEEEIRKHTHLKSITLRGSKKEKGTKFLAFSHFYLINYDALLQEKDRLKMFLKIKKIAIVLDESQKIKNPYSKTAQAIFELKPFGIKRIIISGTPIANKPEDIWAQFYFLDDGELLGKNFDEFKKRYSVELRGNEPLQSKVVHLDTLKNIINRVSIRRLKNQVLELPEKKYEDVFVDLQNTQKSLYEKLKEELFLQIRDLNGQQVIDESENILKKLLRLTQIASNPALIDSGYAEEPAKYTKLDELVMNIVDRNEKVIIWSSFTGNIRGLRKRYKNYNSQMLFGEIPIEERNKIVKRFQEDANAKVLVANPAAAREGLTLTASNNAIYLDRNFNLVDYLQSQDRIHRISQTKPCNVIRIIARDTIDEYIDEILYKKQKIAQYLQGDIKYIEEEKDYLTKEDILRILG